MIHTPAALRARTPNITSVLWATFGFFSSVVMYSLLWSSADGSLNPIEGSVAPGASPPLPALPLADWPLAGSLFVGALRLSCSKVMLRSFTSSSRGGHLVHRVGVAVRIRLEE